MNQNQGLLSSGLSMVLRNKRYIFWFWLLNLTLAEFGTAAFRRGAHAIMDHSLYAGRVLPSLDLGIVIDLLMKPSFGSMNAMTTPALYFAVLFFVAVALFCRASSPDTPPPTAFPVKTSSAPADAISGALSAS